MAKVVDNEPDRPSDPPLKLRDPGLAALFAWLWPGAGHLYQGRTAKGVLFMLCILGTFLYGMYLGQGRVVFVYRPGGFRPEMFRWPYLCQVGAGLPALPALVKARLGRNFHDNSIFDSNDWYAPPDDDAEWNVINKQLHRYFELGTVFTMIAGLLNILAIYDAWGGPAFVPERQRSKEPDDASDVPVPAGM